MDDHEEQVKERDDLILKDNLLVIDTGYVKVNGIFFIELMESS